MSWSWSSAGGPMSEVLSTLLTDVNVCEQAAGVWSTQAFLGRAMLLTADRQKECLLFNRKWSNFYLESKAKIWEAEGGICLVCVEAVGLICTWKRACLCFMTLGYVQAATGTTEAWCRETAHTCTWRQMVGSLISLCPVSFGGGFDLVMEAFGLGHEPSWRGKWPFF